MVSVLFNEPKLLKYEFSTSDDGDERVSVLFNEPKLLKSDGADVWHRAARCFSALQRAEIAEIQRRRHHRQRRAGFSALQRAEIAEIRALAHQRNAVTEFQCSSTSRNC